MLSTLQGPHLSVLTGKLVGGQAQRKKEECQSLSPSLHPEMAGRGEGNGWSNQEHSPLNRGPDEMGQLLLTDTTQLVNRAVGFLPCYVCLSRLWPPTKGLMIARLTLNLLTSSFFLSPEMQESISLICLYLVHFFVLFLPILRWSPKIMFNNALSEMSHANPCSFPRTPTTNHMCRFLLGTSKASWWKKGVE